MMRVRAIYWLRKLSQPSFIKVSLFVTVSASFLLLVDVPHVVLNALSAMKESGSVAYFFSSAFAQSLLIIKLMILAELVFLTLFVKDALEHLAELRLNIS